MIKETPLEMIKIDESVDSMTQTLSNIAMLINQQTLLVNTIKESKNAEKFKQFIDATEKDCKSKQEQYDTLLKHRDMLAALHKKYDAASDADKQLMHDVIFDIFVAFNVITDGELLYKKD